MIKARKFIDYYELEKAVEERSGRDVRDWAGAQAKPLSNEDYLSGNFPTAIWAKEKGYDWTVLNDIQNPDGTTSRRSKEDLELRAKINNEYLDYLDDNPHLEVSYQDFWHYAIDNIFYDVTNGSVHYFNPSEHLAEIIGKDLDEDNFVKEILSHFIEVFRENSLPDEVMVMISW